MTPLLLPATNYPAIQLEWRNKSMQSTYFILIFCDKCICDKKCESCTLIGKRMFNRNEFNLVKLSEGIEIPRNSHSSQTFPAQPEQLRGVSRVHLWVSGMSLSDCNTPTLLPPPIFNPIFKPRTPHRWHKDHLNDPFCGKILRLPACVKRSRMLENYSQWCAGRWR